VAIDLGTGDGRHVLAAAAARPDTLVVGVDAISGELRPGATVALTLGMPGRPSPKV
jgi:hypothetical protein